MTLGQTLGRLPLGLADPPDVRPMAPMQAPQSGTELRDMGNEFLPFPLFPRLYSILAGPDHSGVTDARTIELPSICQIQVSL